MYKRFIAGCALLAPLSSFAAVLPEGTFYDNRIRYVHYNEDDVVTVKTRLGHATVIQLEKGEHLNSDDSALAIGDKDAWVVAVRENNVIIKPIAPFPETNINIISNKRVYALDLVEAKTAKDVSFYVRFKYPKPSQIPPAKELAGPCADGKQNHLYYKYGDEQIAPFQVWDDGKFTCFRFPHNQPIPAIYKYDEFNEFKESLINFNMVDDVIVVQDVSKEFRLRFDKLVLGIKTDNLNGIIYNNRRTATGEQRKVIKHEQ